MKKSVLMIYTSIHKNFHQNQSINECDRMDLAYKSVLYDLGGLLWSYLFNKKIFFTILTFLKSFKKIGH